MDRKFAARRPTALQWAMPSREQRGPSFLLVMPREQLIRERQGIAKAMRAASGTSRSERCKKISREGLTRLIVRIT
jgi:hypothetical protein